MLRVSINRSIDRSIDRSIYLSIYLSYLILSNLILFVLILSQVILSIYLSIYPSIHPSIRIFLLFYRYLIFVYLSVHLFAHLSVYLSFYLSICLAASLKTKLFCETSSILELTASNYIGIDPRQKRFQTRCFMPRQRVNEIADVSTCANSGYTRLGYGDLKTCSNRSSVISTWEPKVTIGSQRLDGSKLEKAYATSGRTC